MDTHVWVAGSPGTRIFHSPDGGKRWEVVCHRSVRAASRASRSSMPTTVGPSANSATSWPRTTAVDPGKRSAPAASALRSSLFSRDRTDVPLELLADVGAADGYIAAVDILCIHRQVDGPSTAQHATKHRSREAMLLAGAASADTSWRFPLPAADLALAPADLLAALNRENDGRAHPTARKPPRARAANVAARCRRHASRPT